MSPLDLNNLMPVDVSTITTSAKVSPDLLMNPVRFAARRGIPLRGAISIKSPAKKFGQFRDSIVLDIMAFGGARVRIMPIDRSGLSDIIIRVNPGIILYAHNGRPLTASGFSDALAILANTMRHLLEDPNDWRRMIPGLSPDSPAHWSYLEIPFHCHDPEGSILNTLRNARHPSINKLSRHWPTSMDLPGGELQLSVYRKAIELHDRGKLQSDDLAEFEDILRIELRLKHKKLVKHLGNGTERVVRFRGSDLIRVFRTVLDEIQGIFHLPQAALPPKAQIEALGRYIAWLSCAPGVTQTFHELLYGLCAWCGASDKTRGQLRKAGLAWLAVQSPLTCTTLLSDTAMIRQPHVVCRQLERLVCRGHPEQSILDEVHRVYSPSEPKFYPNFNPPSYFNDAN